MRSKAPLMLMEQMVMLLVFALAAALCLQAFVKADAISRESEARDHAVLLCQSVAEQIKESGEKDQVVLSAMAARLDADVVYPNESFLLCYDEDWQRTDAEEEIVYMLGVSSWDGLEEVPGLKKASVFVQMGDDGKELFRIEVAWQGVTAHA